jgi:hypothetical protein
MATLRGGNKLELVLAKIAKNVSNASVLQVGFLTGATAPNGDSIPLRAAFSEFGTSKQPPRPFFRNMIAAKSAEWGDAIAGLLKKHNYDAALALDEAGSAIEGQLRKSITDLYTPPLAASTIARKGFDKPLIEHGDMLNAVDHEVK